MPTPRSPEATVGTTLLAALAAKPAAREEGDPGFALWRRVGRLVAGAPRWEEWWAHAAWRGGPRMAALLAEFAGLSEAQWAAMEAAKAGGGARARRSNPLSVLQAAGRGGSGGGGGG